VTSTFGDYYPSDLAAFKAYVFNAIRSRSDVRNITFEEKHEEKSSGKYDATVTIDNLEIRDKVETHTGGEMQYTKTPLGKIPTGVSPRVSRVSYLLVVKFLTEWSSTSVHDEQETPVHYLRIQIDEEGNSG
jgi:hypothetical protein